VSYFIETRVDPHEVAEVFRRDLPDLLTTSPG